MDYGAPPVNFQLNNNPNKNLSEISNIKENSFSDTFNINNKINLNNEIKVNKNKEENKIRININSKKLELLTHSNLVELIQFIEYTCDLTLNDQRYENKTYNIFKIIKNKDKKCYDIIIDDNAQLFKQNINSKKYIFFNDKSNKSYLNEEKDENFNMIKIKRNKENIYRINNKDINVKNKGISYINNQKNEINFDDKINPNKRINLSNQKHTNNKIYEYNNINNHKYINDNFENEKEEEEEEENNIINDKTKNFIKCTDCDLVYDTVEEMAKHYYLIHDTSKKKEEIKIEKKVINNKKEEVNKNFEKWAEKRVQNNNKNIIDEEKEENKKKMTEDIEKIFKEKGLKIQEKMKEITLEKRKILEGLKDIKFKDKESEEAKRIEINKYIKERRRKEKERINQETKELIKQLKNENKRKITEIKLNKKQDKNIKIKGEPKNLFGIKSSNGEIKIREDLKNKEDLKNQISINQKEDKDNSHKDANSKNLFLTLEQKPFLNVKDTHLFIICEICNRRFKSKEALFAHAKDKRHFQCNTCGKIFPSKIAIDSHCKDKSHF